MWNSGRLAAVCPNYREYAVLLLKMDRNCVWIRGQFLRLDFSFSYDTQEYTQTYFKNLRCVLYLSTIVLSFDFEYKEWKSIL